MNILLHQTILFITFWCIRINQINRIFSLYPHTLQLIRTIEKIKTNILITLTTTITWIILNNSITKQLIIQTYKNIIINTIIWYLRIKIRFIIKILFLNEINTNSKTGNIRTNIRIKKLYQFIIILNSLLIIIIIFSKTHKYKINRILYFPLIIIISTLIPRELILIILSISLLIPIEISEIIKHTTYKRKRKESKRLIINEQYN